MFQENSSESELDIGEAYFGFALSQRIREFKEKQRAYQGLIRRGISHEVAQLCFKPRCLANRQRNHPARKIRKRESQFKRTDLSTPGPLIK